MSLQLPDFEPEEQEASWWYDHRDLVEAEMIVAGTEGTLKQRTPQGAEAPVTWTVPPHELAATNTLLENSGLWTRDESTSAYEAARTSALSRLKRGFDLGGPPYPKRDRLYKR